jgi:hypothetical protein
MVIMLATAKAKQASQAQQTQPTQIHAIIIVVIISVSNNWGGRSGCILSQNSRRRDCKHCDGESNCKVTFRDHVFTPRWPSILRLVANQLTGW